MRAEFRFTSKRAELECLSKLLSRRAGADLVEGHEIGEWFGGFGSGLCETLLDISGEVVGMEAREV